METLFYISIGIFVLDIILVLCLMFYVKSLKHKEDQTPSKFVTIALITMIAITVIMIFAVTTVFLINKLS